MTYANGSKTHRRVPAYAALTLIALVAAAFIFSSAPPVHGQSSLSVAFGSGVTIASQSYTEGAAAPNEEPAAHTPEWEALRLPEVTVTAPTGTYYYTVTYSATGLPAGLSMSEDRVIRGTPTEATTSAITVTYTANVTTFTRDTNTMVVSQSGTGSAALTFTVTVAPPVTFNEAARKFINSRIVAWKSGKGWLGDTSNSVNEAGISVPTFVSFVAFPTASGGSGTLTYSLLDNDTGQPLADVAGGITFNTTTRRIGGTPAADAQKTWPVTYVAEDANGSRAVGHLAVHAGGFGGI